MSQTIAGERVFPLRLLRKDVGVALVVLVALGLGWLLRYQVEGATTTFQDPNSSFRIAYPRTWISAEPGDRTLLRVEDPRTDSTFKTTLTVQSQGLDPAAPPTLQTMIDRRIAEDGQLPAYSLLATADATVDGMRGASIDYAYVTQPIDVPLRAALPVVVRAREYIVVTQDQVYYIALAAPRNEYDDALGRFERMIDEVRIQ